MNNFFKFLFASCLGTLLALGALILIGVFSVAGIASKFENKDVKVKANTILVLNPGIVPELTDNIQNQPFSLDDKHIYGLRDLTRAIELAKDDDNIKGIFLDVDRTLLAPASALTLRKSIVDFRESGKFVLSHANSYGQGAYFLASAADKVYLNPTGSVDVRGYGATLPYFADALDKAGIKVNVFYAGDFKSAGEPFFRNSISDSNRLQTREYLSDLWRIYIEEVAASRNIPIPEFKRLTEEFLVRNDSMALEARFVDGLWYKDQVLDEMRTRLGLDAKEKIATVSIQDYATKVKPENVRADEKIAVIYAEGTIGDGPDAPGFISGDAYSRLIRKVRLDEDVKAIVLRINSGGGSAMASENIWREVTLAREAGIPVIASMGDVAASGGYYMAVACDSIYAQANTITGSIGVIGLVPNFSELMNDKLGVHFDTVGTGDYSNAFSVVIPFSEKEKAFLQESVNDIYEHFVNRVAIGRNLPNSTVQRLAKGRVYTGEDALVLGLVDRIGDLEAAIAAAASAANLELGDARIAEYPKVKPVLEQLIAQLTGQEDDDKQINLIAPILEREFGSNFTRLNQMRRFVEARGPQMLMLETVDLR